MADPVVASMVHNERLAHVITENVGVIFAIGVVLSGISEPTVCGRSVMLPLRQQARFPKWQ